jgi:predicted enzyme related to lactoylglutathione lyase
VHLFVRSVTIDCADPYALAKWWCEAFGVPMSDQDFPGDPEAICDFGDSQPRLLFEHVPETKSVKNRVHLDLRPATSREEQVERLIALGASLVADHRDPDGGGWVVLADPEGNEFCVERAPRTA